ncbi:LCP family protein [Nocardioides sp. GXZ039]|uniref:LCP family protein n=1 Tax=Nocardioides sp. GXZ039 TaxID=3136018 RepID=UPI0030F41BFD
MSDDLSARDTISDDDPADSPATSGERAGKRRGRGKKRYKVLTVVTACVVTLGLVAGLGATYFYRHLNDNIDYQNYSDQLNNRPAKKDVAGPQEPMNILVMGSDTRDGEGNNIDGLTGDGERSDTTILFHLSADRSTAYGISIPRDSLVDRPECTDEDGKTIPGADNVMWNEAFAVGGPACTMQQFEQLTGIRLDNYVKVDFNGFRDMVDAIDGVEVCLPEAVEDPAHGISIPAGTREVRGKEALNYVRARYTLGDGSDLGRIKRQQAFIAAMASKLLSAGTLTRVDRVVGFLDAATSSLQTDFKSVTQIAKVGNSFKGIGADQIRFVTVPWQYSPEDPNRVAWLPEADALWKRVINDEPLPARLTPDVITAADDVSGSNGSNSGSGAGANTGNDAGSSTGAGDGGGIGGTADDQAAARESAGLCT